MEGTSNQADMRKEEDKMISNSQIISSSPEGFKDCSINMPSWLRTQITDLEERMKVLTLGVEDEEVGDTFAERAESYYQKRPQLLTLLQDLYNGYITLSDRYIQTLAKHKHHHHHHSRHSSQVSTIEDGFSDQEEASGISGISQVDSDMESSPSFHQPPPQSIFSSNPPMIDLDSIVAELVTKNVDYEIMMHEVSLIEKKYCESSRKIDLQKSLLEVLESERLVLLNENASLGFRVKALMEENKGLASESMFVKRKAGELAKYVVKLREDHRVFVLHRKIEDLQAQIHGLEKRNKEYYEQLLVRDNNGQEHDSGCLEKKGKNSDGIALEIRLHMQRLSRRFKWKEDIAGKDCELKKSPSMWKKVKNMDFLLCGMNPTCA